MQVFVGVLCAALVAVAAAEGARAQGSAAERPLRHYHSSYGIAAAERIRRAEAAAVSGGGEGGRIAGGAPAALGQFPYVGGVVITLTSGATSVCGSSLLSNSRALTAAQCWWDGRNRARRFTVVFGSLRLFSGGQRVDTDQVETHISWNPDTHVNDIAMIRFDHVGYTGAVWRVALPSGELLNDLFSGRMAEASGFGRTGQWSGGAITADQVLSHVSLEVVTNPVCRNLYGSFVTAAMLCTSGAGGRSTCPGDTGGPLVVATDLEPVLIGVTSFFPSSGCQSVRPAGYTRVTAYIAWIRARI